MHMSVEATRIQTSQNWWLLFLIQYYVTTYLRHTTHTGTIDTPSLNDRMKMQGDYDKVYTLDV